MGNQVIFNEEPSSLPPIRPRGAEHTLVKLGVGANSRDARIVLAALALCAIVGAFYFIASAVPKTPQLGPDVPRHGEVIPANRSL